MKLEVFVTNSLRELSYVLYDENTNDAVCIDPGNEDDSILEYVKKNNLNLKYILLTHGHFDHIMCVESLKKSGAKVVAHKDEKQILENFEYNGGKMFGSNVAEMADLYIDENTELSDVDFNIKVIHTPGHTPGGVCYYLPDLNIMFTGDTLFRETIGRTDFPYGSHENLLKSIATKLFSLPENTVCYTGHGEDTTIEHEKNYNQFFN